jgi:hypothetical protein
LLPEERAELPFHCVLRRTNMSRGNASMPITRYVALDIHREYLTVGAVDSQQHIVLTPRRFGARSFYRLGSDPSELFGCRGAGGDGQCLGALRSAHQTFWQCDGGSPARRQVDQCCTGQNRRTGHHQAGPEPLRQSDSGGLGSCGRCPRAYAPWSPIGNDSSSSQARLAIACKECSSVTI